MEPAAYLNRVTLQGAVGLPPSRRSTAFEVWHAELRIATMEEERGEVWTEWHTVLLTDDQLARCAGLDRGDAVRIEGKLRDLVEEDEAGGLLRRTVILPDTITIISPAGRPEG